MQLARTGWPSEAERFYRKALARGSKVPLAEQVAPGLGDALMDEGRYPESRESLDSALAMGDPTGSCQSSIGQLLLLEGAEPQKALDLADKAIQIAAHDVEVRYRYDRRERGQNLGGSGAWALKAWALAQVGRRAEARQAIDAALKLVDAAQAGSPNYYKTAPAIGPDLRTVLRMRVAETQWRTGMALPAIDERGYARTHFAAARDADPKGKYGILSQQRLKQG
jgi:tetratricopeptide (TPR) repeat protein